MAKGAAIKFTSYEQSIGKLLALIKLDKELKKYDKIVLKPFLSIETEKSTPVTFVETVLKFCLNHKNPVAEVFIAEGADGINTEELFESYGYKKIAEKYPVSLVDLNSTETENIMDGKFMKFPSIEFPKILIDSFVISLPKLVHDEEVVVLASLSSMLGAFPSEFYSGFFSRKKNKIRKWSIKYSIHDISRCKMPNFAIIDASEKGSIFAGLPLEIDKQAAKLLGLDWKAVPYMKLMDEALSESVASEQNILTPQD